MTQLRSARQGNCGAGAWTQGARARFAIRRTFCHAMLLTAFLGANRVWAQTESFLGQVVPLPGAVADVICPATGQMIPAREQPFTVGDRVKKGEPLLVISNRYDLHDQAHLSTIRWDMLKQMIDARYASLEARIARERAERLKEVGTTSGQQVAELKAAEEVAQAEYLRQKAILDQHDEQIQGTTLERRGLVAPITGQISQANFTQGQTVYEGFLLYRIVDLRQVAVSARVPEASFRPWPHGTKARIHIDELPGKEFTGRLELIQPTVDPLTRVHQVLFRVDNPGELLRFGMVGHVEVQVP